MNAVDVVKRERRKVNFMTMSEPRRTVLMIEVVLVSFNLFWRDGDVLGLVMGGRLGWF